MSEDNKEVPIWAKSLADQLETVLAKLEAFESRVDALEATSAASATSQEDLRSGRARVSSPDASFASSTDVSGDKLTKWHELQEKRARSASRGELKVEPAKLEQVAREIETQNITSVQIRLQNLQTAGKLAEFRVLPPGASPPVDRRVDRLLVTVDSNGYIINAEVG
jgi:hypothetical protein